tara:strand:+ start:548 stop:1468 length:921 start_codon:yes stop_codon:yes gene_type:complete
MKEIILHCRSKDCEKITQGTVNSHIQVVLPEAIIPKTNETIKVKLVSAEIPYSWHNVSDNLDNNYITYNSIETIQLGSKNYTATELIKFLNSLTEQPFSFSYDLFTGRVTITNNDDADHTINFGVGNIRSVLGAKNQDELIQAGTSKELESLLDLVSVHAVYVKTSLASGNVMSTNTTNSTTLQKIQVENNSGSIIYLDLTSFITVSELQSHVIDTFDMQLCDQNNRLIDLNLVDWEATLVFEIVEGEPTEVEMQTAQPAQPLEPVEISEDDLAEIEMDNLIDKLRDESGLNDDEVEDENNIIDII